MRSPVRFAEGLGELLQEPEPRLPGGRSGRHARDAGQAAPGRAAGADRRRRPCGEERATWRLLLEAVGRLWIVGRATWTGRRLPRRRAAAAGAAARPTRSSASAAGSTRRGTPGSTGGRPPSAPTIWRTGSGCRPGSRRPLALAPPPAGSWLIFLDRWGSVSGSPPACAEDGREVFTARGGTRADNLRESLPDEDRPPLGIGGGAGAPAGLVSLRFLEQALTADRQAASASAWPPTACTRWWTATV